MDTLMGILIGGVGGYMLSENNKDMKKVADREVWAIGGAALGHLLQEQMIKKAAPAPAAAAQDSAEMEDLRQTTTLLAQELHRTKTSYRRNLDALEAGVNDLLEERAEAPRQATRTVRRVRTAPTPMTSRAPAAAVTRAPAARTTTVGANPAPAPERRLRELPDYQGVRDLDDLTISADLAELRMTPLRRGA